MANTFPISIEEITKFMQVQLKQDEQHQELGKHGGIAGVCQKLKVDPQRGLSNSNKQDLTERETQFGRNEIPAKPPKSFIALMWEAVQDTTLIILIVCAIISLALSFVHFEGDEVTEEYRAQKAGMNFYSNIC